MKTKLRLDAELDILNKAELSDALEQHGSWEREAAFGLRPQGLPAMAGKPANGVLQLGADQPDQPTVGPGSGWYWKVERVSVTGLAPGDSVALYKAGKLDSQYVATLTASADTLIPCAATSNFGAGAAGEAFLPVGTVYLTGFDVSIGAASAGSPETTVTVGSVLSSAFPYLVTESSAGSVLLSVRYPGNGLTASPGLNPGVEVAAAVNGGAGSINVFGLAASSPAGVTYRPSKSLILKPGNFLTVYGSGLNATGEVTVSGEAISVPGPMVWKIIS